MSKFLNNNMETHANNLTNFTFKSYIINYDQEVNIHYITFKYFNLQFLINNDIVNLIKDKLLASRINLKKHAIDENTYFYFLVKINSFLKINNNNKEQYIILINDEYITAMNVEDIDIIIKNNNIKNNIIMNPDKSTFSTIRNTGSIKGLNGNYINQCFWISILDYLNKIKKNNYTIDDIRLIASKNNTVINSTNSVFDYQLHENAAINLAEVFDLSIEIYYSNRNGELLNTEWISDNNPAYIFGTGANRVPIVAYGDHFQLIIKSNSINLENEIDLIESTTFVPNIKLAISMNSDKEYDKQLDSSIHEYVENKQKINYMTKLIHELNKSLIQHNEDESLDKIIIISQIENDINKLEVENQSYNEIINLLSL